jgi:hypothetical protein
MYVAALLAVSPLPICGGCRCSMQYQVGNVEHSVTTLVMQRLCAHTDGHKLCRQVLPSIVCAEQHVRFSPFCTALHPYKHVCNGVCEPIYSPPAFRSSALCSTGSGPGQCIACFSESVTPCSPLAVCMHACMLPMRVQQCHSAMSLPAQLVRTRLSCSHGVRLRFGQSKFGPLARLWQSCCKHTHAPVLQVDSKPYAGR